MTEKTYVGDIGLTISLDCGESVSSSTVRKIKYQRPDGVTGEWVASLNGTTAIKYVTASTSDLPIAGDWLLQSYVEFGTWKGHGETCVFTVFRRFT